MVTLSASCLCGAARFTLPRPAGPVVACHCSQCRRLSGHFSASFGIDEASLAWLASDTIREYKTPAGGTRGFCGACGSSLWFRDAADAFSVEAGCINGPTGQAQSEHIFVADKGDYYRLADGLKQHQGWGDD